MNFENIINALNNRMGGVIGIDSLSWAPAVKKGENHNSRILKTNLTLRTKGGKVEELSVIVKIMPESSKHAKFVKENDFFYKEIQVYNSVLQTMENLMLNNEGTLWCKLLGFNEETIILQNLNDENYVLNDRKQMLGYNESILVIKSLAKYHAMSKILFLKNKLDPKVFKPWMYLENKKIMNMAFHNCLKGLGIVMKKYWGGEWSKIADQILRIPETLTEELEKIGKINNSNLNVLNHGDCWTCNILFKYDVDGKPRNVKFIDFPVAHYNSFAWDLTFFIYNSVQTKIRRNHLKDFIQTYHRHLNATFEKYAFLQEMRSLQKIEDEFNNLKFVSILLLCTIMPLLTSEMTETVVSDEPFKADEKTIRLFTQLYSSPSYICNVKEDLKEYFK